MRVLVIAPHPDDEVLGCGGTIAKHSMKGDEVHLCIITEGYTPDWSEEYLKNRPLEIEKSSKILGIKKVHFLKYPTAKLDTIPQKELNDSLSEIINKIKPAIMYIPHYTDIHQDHPIIFRSALIAARPKKDCHVRKILSYETLSETEWGYPRHFRPNLYVDISDTIELKIKAMRAYGSELKEFPHPRSLEGIKTLAKKRGSEVGLKYAEAFEVIREIMV